MNQIQQIIVDRELTYDEQERLIQSVMRRHRGRWDVASNMIDTRQPGKTIIDFEYYRVPWYRKLGRWVLRSVWYRFDPRYSLRAKVFWQRARGRLAYHLMRSKHG